MQQVSCSDNSRRSYDYRCGEGGMEIKTVKMTDVLRQTGMCNKDEPESFVLCKSEDIGNTFNDSNVIQSHSFDEYGALWTASREQLYMLKLYNLRVTV